MSSQISLGERAAVSSDVDSDSDSDAPTCDATNSDGEPCTNPVVGGLDRCHEHVGGGAAYDLTGKERRRAEERGRPRDPDPTAFKRRPGWPVWKCQRIALLTGYGYQYDDDDRESGD